MPSDWEEVIEQGWEGSLRMRPRREIDSHGRDETVAKANAIRVVGKDTFGGGKRKF